MFTAIGKVRGQWHTGILHRRRPAGAGARVLHLRWHHQLKNEEVEGWLCLGWVTPALLPEQASNLAARCRLVAKLHEDGLVPYGLRFTTSTVRTEGQIVLDEDDAGLSCATFVLVMFRSVGVELVDQSNWPERDGDREFHSWVVKTLRDSGFNDQADRVETEIGCARYRPTEVAAASAITPHPSKRSDVLKPATEIETALMAFDTAPKI